MLTGRVTQDASWDVYRGAVCVVNVVDGVLRSGDRIVSAASGEVCEVMEVGLLAPEPVPLREGSLRAGQVGYIITSSRSLTTARVGDTLMHVNSTAKPLPGFKAAKPMIFQGLFPSTAEDYEVRLESHVRTVVAQLLPRRHSRRLWSGW